LEASINAKKKLVKDLNSDDSYKKELDANREKVKEAEDQLKKGNSS
jgi:hypothetical protein